MELQQGFGISGMRQRDPFATRQFLAAHVRFGSKADITRDQLNVRFTPKSGHDQARLGSLLCAKSRHCTLLGARTGTYPQKSRGIASLTRQVGGIDHAALSGPPSFPTTFMRVGRLTAHVQHSARSVRKRGTGSYRGAGGRRGDNQRGHRQRARPRTKVRNRAGICSTSDLPQKSTPTTSS
jgi:hypothetical protein